MKGHNFVLGCPNWVIFFLKSHRMMQGIQWEQARGLVAIFQAPKTPFSVFKCCVHFEPRLNLVRNLFLPIRHHIRARLGPENYFNIRPCVNGHVFKKSFILLIVFVWNIIQVLNVVLVARLGCYCFYFATMVQSIPMSFCLVLF